ncbi:MAG: hypothetical protein LUM44_01355 [Pyrinomonadaceae bacterium]|nr:hypothetical protein [Pyrinomonadaceae bacterium]
MPIAVRTKKFVPKPANPQADPRFKNVKDKVQQKAVQLKKHPPAKQKADEAAKAAKGPPNEKASGAKAKQVDALKETKAETPPVDSFLTVLRAEIDKVMPSNLDEAKNFMEGGEEAQMKEAVGGNVKDQKETASGDIKKTSDKPPNEGGVQAKPVEAVPPDPNVPPPSVDGAAGMPAPKPEAEISEKQTKADAQTAMKENRLEGKRLENKDPRFEKVKSQKGNVDKVADASPAKYRAAEKQTLGKAAAQANATASSGMTALSSVKNKSKSAVKTRQDAQKKKDEERRLAVTNHIENIYKETKLKVDANINSLERDVMAVFEPGISSAIASFKGNIDREVEKFYDERYSGISGAAQWLIDKFKDTPPEVKAITKRNLTVFTKNMDALAVRVAGLVDKRLNKAKADIDAGQAKIKAYVASLPKDLKSVGQEAEKAMESRFTEMRDGVEAKKNDLAQKMAAKYKEAHDKANEYAKKVEEENAGAFKGLIDAIGEVIKVILEFKDKLMALLKKAADAIELILDDPIGFLGNLIAAVKQGVNQFVGNIWTHLKAGFMKWLFGALADAGIEIPADLSLVSIFKLVMSVLGITYAKMRAKAVKLLGPTAVAVIEKLVEYVGALISGGPAKLWEQIKSDIGDLKAMVIGAIQSWLIETVIKQAAIKLLSFFNPAGAFVQAVMAIYNTVVFIVENAAKIMAFVEAVINSVSSIAQGAIGAAASWIEKSLASIIPLVIGFLARLIGLGGISKKIKEFITKVQTKVDQAIDKAIAKVVQVVKKLFGKLSGKPGKKERTEAEKKADVKKAANEAKSAGSGTKNWLKLKLQLRKIKTKYDLTSLTLSKKGKKITVNAEINPKEAVQFELPLDSLKDTVKKAQTAVGSATSATAQATSAAASAPASAPAKAPAPTPAAPAKSSKADMGKVYETERRTQLGQVSSRPDAANIQSIQTLPTKKGDSPRGIDAAYIVTRKDGEKVVELNEIKEGSALTVFGTRATGSGTGNVRGDKIDIGPALTQGADESAAVVHLRNNPKDIDRVAAGAKMRVDAEKDGKPVKKILDSKLSGLTHQIETNLQTMYKLMEQAASDPSAEAETIKFIQDVIAGKGGTLKLVIDIKASASISEGERKLAKDLLLATFKRLTQAEGEVKTKLELVLRKVDAGGTSSEEKL